MPIQDIGQRIAKLRKESGWSQMELAEQLNVSDKTVSKWENGGMPGIDLLPALSSLFNVSIDYLLTGSEKTVSNEASEYVNSEETHSTVKETTKTESTEKIEYNTTYNNESAFDRLDKKTRLQKKLPENYVCPKCKRVNEHPDDQCKYCYYTFSWDEPSLPDDYVCPKCNRVNHKPGAKCLYCYCDFAEAARKAEQAEPEQKSFFKSLAHPSYFAFMNRTEPAGCLSYLLAFIFPLVGFIWGLKIKDNNLKIFSAVIFMINMILRLFLITMTF